MLFRRLLPSLVVATGLVVIAVIASGAIHRDRDARLEAAERAVADEAEALARKGEAALASIARGLREGPRESRDGASEIRVFLVDGGGSTPVVLPVIAPPLDPAERDRLEHSLEAGDALFAAGEPLRAIDAYTYLLAKISDRRARGRLHLAAAVAALETEEMRAFGMAILEELISSPIDGPPNPLGAPGLPLDLLARLASPAATAAPVTASDLLDRADRWSPTQLSGLARRFSKREGWVDDPRFDAEISRRTEGEEVVAENSPALRRGGPVLSGRWLLLSEGEEAAGRAIEIQLAPVSLPEPPTGWSAEWAAPTSSAPTVSVEGSAVASVTLVDPDLAAELASIHVRAARLRWLLFAVLTVVGIAVLATWTALDRQRRLAALRMRLLANVSHELKTPVTSIRMLGELLEQGALPPDRVQEFGKLITRESQRLGTRIEEILETARSERTAAPLSRETLALPEVLAEIVEPFRGRVAEVKGEITLDCAEVKAPLATHRDALERIVENLVDNALKYGARADRETGPHIEVSALTNGEVARVSVEDDGPGISAGDKARIFEPFFRAQFDDFSVAGTGLGLSISRNFAERLGGSLEHSSRPGGGSRFTLTLPLEETASSASHGANTRGVERNGESA